MSAARTTDRQRAIARRDHKHGESETDFEARMLEQFRQTAGDRYTVKLSRGQQVGKNSDRRSYVLGAYAPNDAAPAIRIERGSLSACATAFGPALDTLALGFCGKPPKPPLKKRRTT